MRLLITIATIAFFSLIGHSQSFIRGNVEMSYLNLVGFQGAQSFESQYSIKKNNISAAFRCVENKHKSSFFDSYYLRYERNDTLFRVPFSIECFFTHRRIDFDIRQHNFGLLVGKNWNHWKINIGNNSKYYYQSSASMKLAGLSSSEDSKIKEWRNFIYHFEFFLRPINRNNNFSIGVGNYDLFLPRQENNPFLIFCYKRQIFQSMIWTSKFQIYNAGMANLAAELFSVSFCQSVKWVF